MKINFTKMHGCGNDFMVIDGINQAITLSKEQIRYLSNRNKGVGFDQLLVVEAAFDNDTDFTYRIFNADGGEVEQCGNGARCVARFVKDKGIVNKDTIYALSKAGVLELVITPNNDVTVQMGMPSLSHEITINDITLDCLSMGNPHGVVLVDSLAQTDVETLGPFIQNQDIFSEGINAGFMEIVNSEHIKLRVYERGAGETLACGSGACAAVVVGQLKNQLANTVRVDLLGGSLTIYRQGSASPVYLTGPATSVYEGMVSIP